jgi:hypothetical protein
MDKRGSEVESLMKIEAITASARKNIYYKMTDPMKASGGMPHEQPHRQ